MLGGASPEQSAVLALVRVVAIAAAAGLLARVVPPLPGILVAYGRYAATWVGQNEIIYVGEGVTASVAVSRTPSGALNYHNAGKVQASSEPQDMRLQRMLGHITTLVPEEPEQGAGDRLRSRRDRRRGIGRSAGEGPDHRRDRAAGAAGRVHALLGAQLRRGAEPEGQGAPRRRAALSPDHRTRSSTPSPRTRWTRGSRAPPRCTRASSSTW